MSLDPVNSWAIFHVVGANPAMKSVYLAAQMPILSDVDQMLSDVSVLSDHDLPPQIRLLLLHWCNNAGVYYPLRIT